MTAPVGALREEEGVEAPVRIAEWSGVPGRSVWAEDARSASGSASGVGGVRGNSAGSGCCVSRTASRFGGSARASSRLGDAEGSGALKAEDSLPRRRTAAEGEVDRRGDLGGGSAGGAAAAGGGAAAERSV